MGNGSGKTKTSISAGSCSTKFSLGVPGEIRTPDILLRRQTLYPLSYRHMVNIV